MKMKQMKKGMKKNTSIRSKIFQIGKNDERKNRLKKIGLTFPFHATTKKTTSSVMASVKYLFCANIWIFEEKRGPNRIRELNFSWIHGRSICIKRQIVF